MERLLRGTTRPEVRWHAWRRAGACYLRTMGLPWRFLCWWGRWESLKTAHYYATPPDDWAYLDSARLPWPSDGGWRWKQTYLALLWPKFLRDLCEDAPKMPPLASASKRPGDSKPTRTVSADTAGDVEQPPGSAKPRVVPTIVGTPITAISKRRRVLRKGNHPPPKGHFGARTAHKRAQFLWRPPRPPPNRTPSQQIDQPFQMQVNGLLPRVVLPEPQTKGVPECSTSILISPRPKPVGAEESQPNSPVVSVPVQREATDLIDQSVSAPRTWQVRSDGQRHAPLDFSCPRLQAVELLLYSPRGLS